MSTALYCGRASKISHAELMSLINISFGALTPESALDGLLPKCYREHYRPQDQNYVITEDGTPVAAVGAYDHEINVCGRRLACRGIGNVAVHPEHRSKGYMQIAMKKALGDMVSDGIVLSTLAGHRQRYQYFGYEKSGAQYCFNISPQNIRHLFKDLPAPYTLKLINDPDDTLIDEIIRISERKPYFPVRPREKYLDIANTWKADLFAFTDDSNENRFVGYCIMSKSGTVTEIGTKKPEYLMGMMHSVYAYLNKGFTVNIPSFDLEFVSILAPIAEDHSLGVAMMYNIFNYKTVIEAFMALKLSYITLSDGELTLLIHGFAKDEALRITVKDGKHTVSPCDSASVDIELEHLQAIELLLGPISAFREKQNALIRSWFPLPLWMYSADEV